MSTLIIVKIPLINYCLPFIPIIITTNSQIAHKDTKFKSNKKKIKLKMIREQWYFTSSVTKSVRSHLNCRAASFLFQNSRNNVPRVRYQRF